MEQHTDTLEVVLDFFDEYAVNRLARESGFIKRKPKLEALPFLLVLMFRRLEGDMLSLNDISAELKDKFDCEITKQSLNERFKPEAVKFVKSVINHVLEEKLDGAEFGGNFLGRFSKIKIQDSTSFQLPESMKEDYPGSGGSCTGALARIQFEYDIKEMEMTTLELTPGDKQDVSYSQENTSGIQPGELILRDLGYVSKKFLSDVISAQAFFVNRLHTNQVPYVKDSEGNFSRLDFAGLLRKSRNKKGAMWESEIFLEYEKGHLAMRLIAEPVPEAVYQQRIRKAEKNAKKKGRNISDEYRLRAKFNLFVTNTLKEDLPKEYIRPLYGIRWQIELIFKTWKSTFNVHKNKRVKKERFECELLTRLLLIILGWKIYRIVNFSLMQKNEVCPIKASYYKFNKLIAARLESFMTAVIHSGKRLVRFVESLVDQGSTKQNLTEIKKDSESSIKTFEILSKIGEISNF